VSSQGILAAIKSSPGVADREVFNPAREEIYKLQERDTFPRFKHSTLFQVAMQQLGMYTDLIPKEALVARPPATAHLILRVRDRSQ
jgi:hypothetical protein